MLFSIFGLQCGIKTGVVKDLCSRSYKATILFAFLNIVAFLPVSVA